MYHSATITIVKFYNKVITVKYKEAEPKNVKYPGKKLKKKISPVTGLEWTRGFQEVKVLRFHNNGTGRW